MYLFHIFTAVLEVAQNVGAFHIEKNGTIESGTYLCNIRII